MTTRKKAAPKKTTKRARRPATTPKASVTASPTTTATLLKYAAVVVVAVVVGMGVWQGSKWLPLRPQPGPPPAPSTSLGQSMLDVFAVNPDKAQAANHAEVLCEICRRAAYRYEFDGQRQSPWLKTGANLAECRDLIRREVTNGLSFAPQYPALKSVVGDFCMKAIGPDPKAVDAAARKRWVDAMRELSDACGYASQALKL